MPRRCLPRVHTGFRRPLRQQREAGEGRRCGGSRRLEFRPSHQSEQRRPKSYEDNTYSAKGLKRPIQYVSKIC
uniref:Uncharacterized protein n=1 Tax=Arundo donax TaxID=35708 RepID=A0A0A8ZCE5_ARUDO